MRILLSILMLCTTFVSWSQDTTFIPFYSDYHLKYDFRNFNYELENSVDFMPNRHYSFLNDGIYVFFDSLSNKTRLTGKVINGSKNGKWRYFDSLGILRIEDVFLNDPDSTLITNYFHSNGNLYRVKESSNKYLRTTRYNSDGVKSIYFMDYIDSNNIQMSFDSLGRISYQSSMVKGKKHGIFYWTHDDGSLYSKRTYIHGKKEGIWQSGFKGDRKVWCQEVYHNDKLVSITFYDKLSYEIDSSEIIVKDYYENRKIRIEGKVVNGYKSGIWKFYDIEGEVIGEFYHDEFGNVSSISSLNGKLSGMPAI